MKTIGHTITLIILIAMLVLIGAGEAWALYRLATGMDEPAETIGGVLTGAAFLTIGVWMLWRLWPVEQKR